MGTRVAGPLNRKHSELLTWGILVGGALVLRSMFASSRLVLTGDELHYAESLHRFLGGRILAGVSDYWSFFYPFAAIPFGALVRDVESGLRLLSLLSGAALVIPCVMLAKRLWGRRVALYAGLFIALHPILILISTDAMTESFYSLLLMLSILFFAIYMKAGTWRSLVAFGILLGLAFQTRQEAQFLLVIAVLVIISGRGGEGVRGALKSRLQRAVVIVALFVLTGLPYMMLLHQKTGRWTTGSKASINLSSTCIWEKGPNREQYVYSLNDEGTARRIEEVGRRSVFKIFWEQKRSIVARYFPTMSGGFNLIPVLLASPLLLLLIPIGLFGRKWEKESRGVELVLVLSGLLPFVLYAFFDFELRYLVPFLPLYLLWAARGCEALCEWLRTNISPRPVICSIVLVMVFASLVPFTVKKYRTIADNQPLEYREIGRWIRNNFDRGVRLLAHSGCPVSYYAGSPEATFIPWTDAKGLMRYARFHGYDMLLVDEEYFRLRRPDILSRLGSPRELGLVKLNTFAGRRGNKKVLYRIVP